MRSQQLRAYSPQRSLHSMSSAIPIEYPWVAGVLAGNWPEPDSALFEPPCDADITLRQLWRACRGHRTQASDALTTKEARERCIDCFPHRGRPKAVMAAFYGTLFQQWERLGWGKLQDASTFVFGPESVDESDSEAERCVAPVTEEAPAAAVDQGEREIPPRVQDEEGPLLEDYVVPLKERFGHAGAYDLDDAMKKFGADACSSLYARIPWDGKETVFHCLERDLGQTFSAANGLTLQHALHAVLRDLRLRVRGAVLRELWDARSTVYVLWEKRSMRVLFWPADLRQSLVHVLHIVLKQIVRPVLLEPSPAEERVHQGGDWRDIGVQVSVGIIRFDNRGHVGDEPVAKKARNASSVDAHIAYQCLCQTVHPESLPPLEEACRWCVHRVIVASLKQMKHSLHA